MTAAVLDDRDLEQFMEEGYCMLPEAFTREQAGAASDCLWRRMTEKAGIQKDRPETWPDGYDIEEHLTTPEVVACFSDRLAAGVEQLVGPGRWQGERRWGLWPVNLRQRRDRPYDIPSWGWHIDGNWFTHTVDNPKQGLLVVGLFTDIEPRWGGTIFALGSHKRTARVLAQYSDGLSHRELFAQVLREPLGNFHELTGRAGDVALCHPFLFHTRGMKHGGPPRIISNTETPLTAPLRFDRERAEESVLERSIREALQAEPVAPRDAKLCQF